MFYKAQAEGYRGMVQGITAKTLVFGEKTLCSEFRLAKGSSLPRHSHVYEQTGYLVSGRLKLMAGDEVYLAEPGDCWCIAGTIEHSAEALEESVAIEVFSPVRPDYLPENLAKK